jgi:hypothetical protein
MSFSVQPSVGLRVVGQGKSILSVHIHGDTCINDRNVTDPQKKNSYNAKILDRTFSVELRDGHCGFGASSSGT